MRLPRPTVLLLLLALAWPAAAAEPLAQLPGLIREPLRVSVPVPGGTARLEALVTRPAAAGRHPLVVLSHGTPRNAEERPGMKPQASNIVAIEFARRGYAVVAVMRRGYGQSDGPYAEELGGCKTPDYPRSAGASAHDVAETVKALGAQPWADPQTVLLVGQSAGGLASVAAGALRPPGVKAVINLAGGRGSPAPDQNCRGDLLAQTYGTYGKTTTVPTLWLYSENDHFFGPKLAQSFFTAFKASGGKGEFVALPAFGEDGHALTSREGVALWREPVDRFLRQHGLPTWSAPVAETLAALPVPKQLSAAGREKFESYLALTSFEKAFAVNPSGGFGWTTGHRTPEDAARAALDTCAKYAQGCTVYAINNALAK